MAKLAGVVVIVLIGLGACSPMASTDVSASASRGRYAGIGTFPAGRMWKQSEVAKADPADRRAGLSDDEQIIVVVDSHTGEVRQCGDRSGQCVSMNPWSADRKSPTLPATLQKHADELKESIVAENAADSSDR